MCWFKFRWEAKVNTSGANIVSRMKEEWHLNVVDGTEGNRIAGCCFEVV